MGIGIGLVWVLVWILESLADAGRVATARSQQWSSGRGQRDLFYPDIFVYGQDKIYFGQNFGVLKLLLVLVIVGLMLTHLPVAWPLSSRGQSGLCSFLSLVNALQWYVSPENLGFPIEYFLPNPYRSSLSHNNFRLQSQCPTR